MQDYRAEIEEFFASDTQLASELEYDMKQYQEQEQMEQELVRQVARTGQVLVTQGRGGWRWALAIQQGRRPLSKLLSAACLQHFPESMSEALRQPCVPMFCVSLSRRAFPSSLLPLWKITVSQ